MKKKLNALLLTFCILFSVVAAVLPVYAIEEDGGIGVVGATDSVLKVEKLVLNEDDVPEVISFQSAQEKGHVLRLRDKEADDYTVVFLNDDNTETMYLFAEPVKYTDEYGNKKDKSTALTLKNNAYTMAENDISVSFPREAANGISVSKGAINITMSPVATAVSDKLTASTDSEAKLGRLSENKMVYTEVFENASLVYTPLYSGFKEDIVLDSFDGVNEFSFVVSTNGLYPIKQENGAVWFYDPYTDELVAKMMQVVCYDSENDFSEGDVRITEVKENQIYTFTIIADTAFLSDENTAYPVYIDPTITLNTEAAIEDTVVYSGKPTRNYGTHSYLNVGYVDDSYKNGEMLVKFPALATNSVFANIEPSSITSASLVYYTASGKSGTQRIQAYQLNMGNWDVNTVTWNSMPMLTVGNPPTLLSTATVSTSGGTATTIDITNAARTWANSSSNVTPNQGLLICNETENDATKCRDFMSVDYAASSSSREQYMPRAEVSYLNQNIIEIIDEDGTNNDTLQIRKGYAASYDVVVRQNGNEISVPSSMLQFTSSDITVARFSDNGGTTRSSTALPVLTGVSKGETRISVEYFNPNDLPRATDWIDVAVWEDEYEIIVNTMRNFDISNGTSSRLYLNPRCKHKGVLLESSTFRYSIDVENSYCVNIDSINVSSNGYLTLASNLNPLTDIPAGRIRVKVEYEISEDNRISKYVIVNIVNDDYDNSGLDMYEAAAIRIAYTNINGHTHTGDSCNDCLLDVTSFLDRITTDNDNMLPINSNFNFIEGVPVDSNGCDLFDTIRRSKVAVVMSHGAPGSFVINAENTSIQVTSEDILKLPQGYFSECELIICIFCSAGSDNYEQDRPTSPSDVNIVEAFVEKGAQRVVGFVDTVSQYCATKFATNFITYLGGWSSEQGETGVFYSYYDACKKALEDLQENKRPEERHVFESTYSSNAMDGDLMTFKYFWDEQRSALMAGRSDFDEKLFDQ